MTPIQVTHVTLVLAAMLSVVLLLVCEISQSSRRRLPTLVRPPRRGGPTTSPSAATGSPAVTPSGPSKGRPSRRRPMARPSLQPQQSQRLLPSLEPKLSPRLPSPRAKPSLRDNDSFVVPAPKPTLLCSDSMKSGDIVKINGTPYSKYNGQKAEIKCMNLDGTYDVFLNEGWILVNLDKTQLVHVPQAIEQRRTNRASKTLERGSVVEIKDLQFSKFKYNGLLAYVKGEYRNDQTPVEVELCDFGPKYAYTKNQKYQKDVIEELTNGKPLYFKPANLNATSKDVEDKALKQKDRAARSRVFKYMFGHGEEVFQKGTTAHGTVCGFRPSVARREAEYKVKFKNNINWLPGRKLRRVTPLL